MKEKERVVKKDAGEENGVKESARQEKDKSKRQSLKNEQAIAHKKGDYQTNQQYKKVNDTVKKIDTPVAESAEEITEDTIEDEKEETKRFARNLEGHQIKKLLLRKDFWQLVREILRLLKSILKYVLPRKWSYELVIGKDDPADTGELIAKLTMAYQLYYKHGIIRGDFEKSGIWGGFLAKGRFSIVGILKRIISFTLKPVVRKYIRLVLKIRKEEKYGE
ncbi:hypothetical protein [Cellulosilyticum ruminicola]|uniref:hypothetical protein n=1 Tax=Cellulosilyticum ruminicola TaxID=425254 RepID=UPI0012EDD5B5|nr:hypothetical protein [Cellulosilyticum ruminicola]